MFNFKRKNLVYFLLIVIPFVLFFTQPQLFDSFKSRVTQIVSVPIKLLSYPVLEAKKILFYHRTFNEYKKLRKETALLKSRLIGKEELSRENIRLEKLLEFKRSLVYSSVAAQVIGRNPSYWNSTIIIDKGEVDGLKQGMAVVNDAGVVGKIAEVGPETSKVVLVSDPSFSVAALVQRPRESVLITGSLQGACRMRYISPDADIKLGDKVITSKLSGSFPEGIMIGHVTDIQESGSKKEAQFTVQPSVTLSQLEEVLIIIK